MPSVPSSSASLVALLAGLTLASPTHGASVPGGGAKDADCLTAFVAPANKPASKPKKIHCVDGDPSCDDDPSPGTCRFLVDVCANVSDPTLQACTPGDLEFFTVENVHPDTDPRHDFEFQGLEDAVNTFVMPVTSDENDVCAGEVAMVLPLEAKVRANGAKWKKSKKTLHTAAQGPFGVRDDDKLSMTCLPQKGADACADVTSTFDQIQQQIFDGSCGRQTCHNAPQSQHTLTLAPAEAFAALVGVMPDDPLARSRGKLRVDPGNPANSYLLDKLRGDLEPAQGLRMPRQLAKLPKKKIRLIEAWIEAGAPTDGFVQGIGCGQEP
jgi:hypothetical protein